MGGSASSCLFSSEEIENSYAKIENLIELEAGKPEKELVHVYIVETPLENVSLISHHFISYIDQNGNITNYEWTKDRGIKGTNMSVNNIISNNLKFHCDMGFFTRNEVDSACWSATYQNSEYHVHSNNCNHWCNRVYKNLIKKEIYLECKSNCPCLDTTSFSLVFKKDSSTEATSDNGAK